MRSSYEIKETIERMQSALDELRDDYLLARAQEKAAYAQAMAEKAAQEARDMENRVRTRKRKREERREAFLNGE